MALLSPLSNLRESISHAIGTGDSPTSSHRRSRDVFEGGEADLLLPPLKRRCQKLTPTSPFVLFVKHRSNRVLLVDRDRLLELSRKAGSQPLHFESYFHARKALSPTKTSQQRDEHGAQKQTDKPQFPEGDKAPCQASSPQKSEGARLKKRHAMRRRLGHQVRRKRQEVMANQSPNKRSAMAPVKIDLLPPTINHAYSDKQESTNVPKDWWKTQGRQGNGQPSGRGFTFKAKAGRLTTSQHSSDNNNGQKFRDARRFTIAAGREGRTGTRRLASPTESGASNSGVYPCHLRQKLSPEDACDSSSPLPPLAPFSSVLDSYPQSRSRDKDRVRVGGPFGLTRGFRVLAHYVYGL